MDIGGQAARAVSTHSRLKAAGTVSERTTQIVVVFQHTAA